MIFNWILSNKFAIGTPITTKKDQLLLKEKKINSILDLRNKFDLSQINYQEQLDLYRIFNYINIELPDHNSKRLANKAEINLAVNNLQKLLKNGPVFMHCHAAVERCPLISIVFMHKYKGLTINQAYDYVRQQNPNTNVNFKQLKCI